MGKTAKKISAVISVYNSERFIQGCLDNLLQQTVSDQLEIIIINSASGQNEEAVIKKYLPAFRNIKYFRTRSRQTLYASWNRAIRVASGRYIINANTDDRSRADALEVMASVLDDSPEIALVYSDVYVTPRANEELGFLRRKKAHWRAYRAPEYSHKDLLIRAFCGPRPMWRRRLHKRLGLFKENYRIGGDYEFWLRIAEHYPMLRIPQFLCLAYSGRNCLSLREPHTLLQEHKRIRRRYFR